MYFQKMREILNSELFILFINLGVFAFATWIVKVCRLKYLNSLLISIFMVIGLLFLLDIDVNHYQEQSRILHFFLGPSVVCLGFLLHKNIGKIGKKIIPLILCIGLGAIVNSVIINAICILFDVDPTITISLHPKSVTTPIALELSKKLGGISALTILSVVIAGNLGAILGVPILNLFKIKSPMARGAALGSASHAIGTSRAIELGEYEGAVSGLTIGITGLLTALFLPIISDWTALIS